MQNVILSMIYVERKDWMINQCYLFFRTEMHAKLKQSDVFTSRILLFAEMYCIEGWNGLRTRAISCI